MRSSSWLFHLAFSLSFPLPLPAVPERACYLPNGSMVMDHTCNDDASTDTFCCGQDAVCYSDQICWHPAVGGFGRGSCTDPNWKSPSCPQFCHDPAAGNVQNNGATLKPCPNAQPPNTQFCCSPSNTTCNCDSGEGVVTFSSPPAALPGSATTSTASVTSATASTTSITSTTASIVSTASTATSAVSSPPGVAAPADAMYIGMGFGVGFGVGVPAGALILGAFVFLAWRTRYRRSLEQPAKPPQPSIRGGVGTEMPG